MVATTYKALVFATLRTQTRHVYGFRNVAKPSQAAVVEALKANGLDVRPVGLIDLRKERR